VLTLRQRYYKRFRSHHNELFRWIKPQALPKTFSNL
jgi:hypothetical protein